MRVTRTIAGIPIILLILLPCIYCGYFQVKQFLIRQEMRNKLESESLQTITIPVKDFRWYEEGREIVVDGTMFDVKSMEQVGDNYIITGLFDTEETELHIAMGRLQEHNDEGPDASLISVVISQNLILPASHDILPVFKAGDLCDHVINPDEMLYNTFLPIFTPPPRA